MPHLFMAQAIEAASKNNNQADPAMLAQIQALQKEIQDMKSERQVEAFNARLEALAGENANLRNVLDGMDGNRDGTLRFDRQAVDQFLRFDPEQLRAAQSAVGPNVAPLPPMTPVGTHPPIATRPGPISPSGPSTPVGRVGGAGRSGGGVSSV